MSNPQNMEITEAELHKTKNRIAAVDISRILAAFLVMYSHVKFLQLAGRVTDTYTFSLLDHFIYSSSCLFFVYAGYFACRNITWKKAFLNAWWCFAPFILWSVVGLLFLGEIGNFRQLIHAFGLVPQGISFNGGINAPLWFMRDLTFLFLLSPILFKISKYLFPVVVFLSLTPSFAPYFCHGSGYIYSLAFFLFGCWLRTFSKERQKTILQFYSPKLLTLYTAVVLVTGAVVYWRWLPCNSPVSFLRNLLSIIMLHQVSRCIELHFPKTTAICLKLAPVTFLTFAAHWIIFKSPAIGFITGTAWALLLPPGVFILMSAFFFAMKRWCRPLLHLVAHYKLRPDDLIPPTRPETA